MPVKDEEVPDHVKVFRRCELMVPQCTEVINVLFGHLNKFEQITPRDAGEAARWISIMDDLGNIYTYDANLSAALFPTCYGKEFTDRLFGLRRRAPTGQHDCDELCTEFRIEHRPSRHKPTAWSSASTVASRMF